MMIRAGAVCAVLTSIVLGGVGCALFTTPKPATRSYVISSVPIEARRGLLFCFAVAAEPPTGVWWWQPGPTGCDSRITGPGLFQADGARVVTRTGVVDASFRIALMEEGPTDFSLSIANGEMRLGVSGPSVPTMQRARLDVR